MIYVLRNVVSEGATQLATALHGRKLRKTEDGRLYYKPANTGRRYVDLVRNDVVVCWGTPLTNPQRGFRTLNNTPIRSKYEDALALQRAGVRTIEVSRTAPRVVPQAAPVDPAVAAFNRLRELADAFGDIREVARNNVFVRGVNEIYVASAALQNALNTPRPVAPPPQPAGEWIGRANDHVGGTDLLRGTGNDYFVRKLDIIKEFRIHSFLGYSIRAGVKVPREGFQNPHPWIRSYDGGWKIQYDNFKSKEAMRTLAANACRALGLDFGAVDIGMLRDKTYVVLEVNRAPGLEGGTVNAYTTAINRWIAGEMTMARRAA